MSVTCHVFESSFGNRKVSFLFIRIYSFYSVILIVQEQEIVRFSFVRQVTITMPVRFAVSVMSELFFRLENHWMRIPSLGDNSVMSLRWREEKKLRLF